MSTGTWKKGTAKRLHRREGVSLTDSEHMEWINERVLQALSDERAQSIQKRRGIKGYAKL
jgi:hypothetical protein